MERKLNLPSSSARELFDLAAGAVNILTVERGLIRLFEETRSLPPYEQIYYGALEPDEIGIALSLSDCCKVPEQDCLHLEFTLWGRTPRPEELRGYFQKLPRRLPRGFYKQELPKGSLLSFRSISSPLGVLFEPERALGIPVLNAMFFLSVELDVMESNFHGDDAPLLEELLYRERQLPLLELERSAGEYLSNRLKTEVSVELDSLSVLRRRNGAELKLRLSGEGITPDELFTRFPIYHPEFPDENAPLAILPDRIERDYLTILFIY